jgi:hypothetical protein
MAKIILQVKMYEVRISVEGGPIIKLTREQAETLANAILIKLRNTA